jgi:hypothetical protein
VLAQGRYGTEPDVYMPATGWLFDSVGGDLCTRAEDLLVQSLNFQKWR